MSFLFLDLISDASDTEKAAAERLAPLLPEEMASKVRDFALPLKQAEVSDALDAAAFRALADAAAAGEALCLQASSAPWADGWLRRAPNQGVDTLLSNRALSHAVALRLQVDIFEGDARCPLCHMPMDRLGRHAMSCKAGGDTVQRHNAVRNLVFKAAVRGGLRPVLEAPGLLGPPGSERPADELLHAPPSLAQGSARLFERVALDFAVVSPFTVARASEASNRVQLHAASTYAGAKRAKNSTEARCQAAGLGFEPIVFETVGGVEKGGQRILESLIKEIWKRTQCTYVEELQRLVSSISLVLMRAWDKAVEKRSPAAGQYAAGDLEPWM